MAKYEYELVKSDLPLTKEELNELGREGWELIDMLRHATDGYFINYMKRELKGRRAK